MAKPVQWSFLVLLCARILSVLVNLPRAAQRAQVRQGRRIDGGYWSGRNIVALVGMALLFANLQSTLSAADIRLECESMAISGSAGTITVPFSGVRLYANEAQVASAVTLTHGRRYQVVVRGARSGGGTNAGVTLRLDGAVIANLGFTADTPSTDSVLMDVVGAGSSHQLVLRLTTDNGSNDTDIDWVEITDAGVIPPPLPPPVPPSVGAVASGIYRNLFVEAGHSAQAVNDKVEAAWQQLFYGDATTERVFIQGSVADEAYIWNVGNNTIVSEGMSYGMMICVQLDKRTEFEKLWNYTKRHMRHNGGARDGYFAWKLSTAGVIEDPNPASDGEAYFATALFFAAHRWNVPEFKADAQAILTAMLNKENGPIQESVYNMFNADHLVVFTPYANAALFSDPSYHLPAFFELWGRWATTNGNFWTQAASASRAYFPKAAHATTGLMPDYANFDGTPTGGFHAAFRFDAWRAAANVAVDRAWFAADSAWQTAHANRVLAFFAGQGWSAYGNQFELDGRQLGSDHSPGLVSCNAVLGLSANTGNAWPAVEGLWSTPIPSGLYRYYDGMLYLMGLLHVSGKFQAWMPDGTSGGSVVAPTITGQPVNRSVVVGATATFTVTASGTPAPTFQWQKNNVNIGGATSASYTTPATVIGDNGTTYRCVVTNSAGTATSTSATLTVTTVVVVPQTPVAPTVSGAGTATPILSGTSDAGATIRIYDGATLIGTVTANGSGAWTFSPTLTPGTHQITITATNSAGTSAASPPVTVVIPTAPGVPTPVPVPATSSSNSKSCGMGSLAALGAVLGLTGLLGLLRREQR